jgi:hypothetical protein
MIPGALTDHSRPSFIDVPVSGALHSPSVSHGTLVKWDTTRSSLALPLPNGNMLSLPCIYSPRQSVSVSAAFAAPTCPY